MALIHTSINQEKNTMTISYPAKASFLASLIYGKDSRKSFTVPLDMNSLSPEEIKDYPIKPVEVWRKPSVGYDLSVLIPQELKDAIFTKNYTKSDIGLFATVDGQNRKVKYMGPPVEVLGREAQVGFADFVSAYIELLDQSA